MTERPALDASALARVLELAARGAPPEPDGAVDVIRDGRWASVLAFTSHFVVVADVDPGWVHAQLPPGDLSAPLGAAFLLALSRRLGGVPGSVDVVLARDRPGPADDAAGPEALRLREIADRDHPRVRRALRLRSAVRVWRTPDGAGHLLLGRGVADRLEVALEVEPTARGRGLGRRMLTAATALAPPGETLHAQVAPGNAASLRCVLAAGFRPYGGEVVIERPLAHGPGPDSHEP